MLPVLTELAIGIAILMAGSELLLRGGISLSRNRGAGAAAISLTAVGLGLSAPLFYTALQASTTGSPDLAIGMIAGGVFFKALFVLGLCAYIAPVPAADYGLRADAKYVVLAALGLAIAAYGGKLVKWEGLLLLAGLTRYALYVYERPTDHPQMSALTKPTDCSWCAVAYIFVGAGLIMTGADILIDGSVWAARAFGLTELVSAQTVTAAAASLPVLVACLVAQHKKRADLILPIVIYSIMFNILAGAGLASSITTIPVSHAAQLLLGLAAAASLALPVMLRKRQTLGTHEGAVLIALFAAYGVYSLGF